MTLYERKLEAWIQKPIFPRKIQAPSNQTTEIPLFSGQRVFFKIGLCLLQVVCVSLKFQTRQLLPPVCTQTSLACTAAHIISPNVSSQSNFNKSKDPTGALFLAIALQKGTKPLFAFSLSPAAQLLFLIPPTDAFVTFSSWDSVNWRGSCFSGFPLNDHSSTELTLTATNN